jgi:hypothetical protein
LKLHRHMQLGTFHWAAQCSYANPSCHWIVILRFFPTASGS